MLVQGTIRVATAIFAGTTVLAFAAAAATVLAFAATLGLVAPSTTTVVVVGLLAATGVLVGRLAEKIVTSSGAWKVSLLRPGKILLCFRLSFDKFVGII